MQRVPFVLAASLAVLSLHQPVAAGGPIELVSLGPAGAPGDAASTTPAISADGRVVAFQSFATNLVPDDTNDAADCFVHDLDSGVTTRVSVASSGAQADGRSDRPFLSPDGRDVLFQSEATDLVPGDTNGERDVFVHDRITGRTVRVSVDSNGVQGNGDSRTGALSADGRIVAFSSLSTNLVPGDTNGLRDVFVHDLSSGETLRVSVGPGGAEADDHCSIESISGDGTLVVYTSDATNLVPGDTNGVSDVFVHDLISGTTERVSVGFNGVQGNDGSHEAVISLDGRWVCFSSRASNFATGDTNNFTDIFVHDRHTRRTLFVSVNAAGQPGNWTSSSPGISANGRYVSFTSFGWNLVPGDTNQTWDAFVHDVWTRTTSRVSLSASDEQSNKGSHGVQMCARSPRVTFFSSADNLVSGDVNDVSDVFVKSFGGP